MDFGKREQLVGQTFWSKSNAVTTFREVTWLLGLYKTHSLRRRWSKMEVCQFHSRILPVHFHSATYSKVSIQFLWAMIHSHPFNKLQTIHFIRKLVATPEFGRLWLASSCICFAFFLEFFLKLLPSFFQHRLFLHPSKVKLAHPTGSWPIPDFQAMIDPAINAPPQKCIAIIILCTIMLLKGNSLYLFKELVPYSSPRVGIHSIYFLLNWLAAPSTVPGVVVEVGSTF